MTVKSSGRVAKLETDIARTFFEQCDTAISLSCYILLREDVTQLITKRINPADYIDQQTFAKDWQCVHLLSKSKSLGAFDPDAAAYEKYLDAEASCADFNSQFHERVAADPIFSSRLLTMKKWIGRILGRLDRRSLDYCFENMRFGPGATTSLAGDSTYAEKLMGRRIHVSPRALPFATFCLPEIWRRETLEFKIQLTAKGCIVPKNSKISRCIEIQPDLNVYIQLGTGSLLREKLRRFGVDLTSQDLNREMARRGSIDDSLATVDLSSASDLISLSLVRFLLPEDWLDLLEFSRVDLVSWPDRCILLEKWSAMGNGYTFELETLIFYTMLLALCEEKGYGFDQVMAYGDDLVLPSEFLPEATHFITSLGFKVNADKTFGKGLFRESCGHDYWNGKNIRPFFLKGEENDATSFPETCFQYANSIRLWSRRFSDGSYCDILGLASWVRCFTACPEKFRMRIPDGWSGGFISNFDEARPTAPNRKNGWCGYGFKYLKNTPLRARLVGSSYCAALSGQSNKVPFENWEIRPRKRLGFATSTGYVLTWPDLGPWR